ncbi:2-keto-4-pentenoate hydratase [Marinobacter mobilis]|uniref:2-oxo-3-hexenedioate decarboxylase n=1 Tax=Marinobacter mobilis TaxID=488533 RepID=A0A1H3D3K9_9GAMM|nr:fumarylacetoacetate hydrolase family protein [Marinobacter mobilis]SDX61072.1 2-oxo-3-hexenedioate decarboxylase [Marinobacter mobilis]
MPTPLNLESMALEMMAAQDSGQQIRPFTTRVQGFDVPSAYKVAALIHRARLAEGANPVGRKIGFTNPDMWSKYGVCEPIWAYMYDTTVVQLRDSQSYCPIERFSEPKIEPEIIFHFRSDLSPGAKISDVVDAIDWVAHGFEIVQSHFPGWRFKAPDTVADSALHGTLLIGPPRPLHELGNDPVSVLESLSVNLFCNGLLIETGKGSNVLGNPLTAVVHLVSVLGRQSEPATVKAGEIITTGTMTTAQAVQPGQTWQTEVKGAELVGLTVDFVP